MLVQARLDAMNQICSRRAGMAFIGDSDLGQKRVGKHSTKSNANMIQRKVKLRTLQSRWCSLAT